MKTDISHESRNAEIGRTSVGTGVVVGDKLLVKEAESVMARCIIN